MRAGGGARSYSSPLTVRTLTNPAWQCPRVSRQPVLSLPAESCPQRGCESLGGAPTASLHEALGGRSESWGQPRHRPMTKLGASSSSSVPDASSEPLDGCSWVSLDPAITRHLDQRYTHPLGEWGVRWEWTAGKNPGPSRPWPGQQGAGEVLGPVSSQGHPGNKGPVPEPTYHCWRVDLIPLRGSSSRKILTPQKSGLTALYVVLRSPSSWQGNAPSCPLPLREADYTCSRACSQPTCKGISKPMQQSAPPTTSMSASQPFPQTQKASHWHSTCASESQRLPWRVCQYPQCCWADQEQSTETTCSRRLLLPPLGAGQWARVRTRQSRSLRSPHQPPQRSSLQRPSAHRHPGHSTVYHPPSHRWRDTKEHSWQGSKSSLQFNSLGFSSSSTQREWETTHDEHVLVAKICWTPVTCLALCEVSARLYPLV